MGSNRRFATVIVTMLAVVLAGALASSPPAVADPAPTVTAVSPPTGIYSGNTIVTITGTDLSDATSVFFGTVASQNVFPQTPTQVIAISPPGVVGTTVDVTVVTPDGTSAISPADQFTYTAAAVPTVTSVGPDHGWVSGGDTVDIYGTNLAGATAVEFGSHAATIVADTSSEIVVTSPPGTTATTVDITVTASGITSAISPADQFTYYSLSPPPTVTALDPSSGPVAGGDTVTVTGTGFTDDDGAPVVQSVQFGLTPATDVDVINATTLTVTAPAVSAPGTQVVSVTTTNGTSPGPGVSYAYTDASTYLPVVQGLSPDRDPVPGGDILTIFGKNLADADAVHFGDVLATGRLTPSDDGTQLQVTIPTTCMAQNVPITVTTPFGTSDGDIGFTYTEAVPTITAVSPDSGTVSGGTAVTVTGTYLGCATFTVGGTVADVVRQSATSATIVVPAGSGTVDVLATDAEGTSTAGAADRYSYEAARSSIASTTTVSLTRSTFAYGQTADATVRVSAGGAPASGVVTLTTAGSSIQATLNAGAATIGLPAAITPGDHTLEVAYAGDAGAGVPVAASSTQASYQVSRAVPTVRLKLVKKRVSRAKRGVVRVTVAIPGGAGVIATGRVVIRAGGKVLASTALSARRHGTVKIRLPHLRGGRHRLKATFAATALHTAASSRSRTLTVR